MALPSSDKIQILLGPTPLVRLDRLAQTLPQPAPRIWIKRDDLTPLAFGGNKLRKLEWLLADAKAQSADVIVTLGAEQSNHACQTACASKREGLDVVLLLRGHVPSERRGNLRLDDYAGAEIRMSPNPAADWGESVVTELRAAGRRPYLIPYGGSNDFGVLGFYDAGYELAAQLERLDLRPAEVVVSSSSGSTQAGLHLAHSGGVLPCPVLGISADLDAANLSALVARLGQSAAQRFGLPSPSEPIRVSDAYVGPGYAKSDVRTEAAIRALASTEGLFTDPVYTGKALAGLLDLARSGRWGPAEDVVFWHTGGLPALLA